jgi:hypothetical protein
LVAIAALIDRAVRNGKSVKLVRPNSFAVRNYLARMHLGTLLDSLGVPHNLPTVAEADLQDTLLELRTFRNQSDGEKLAGLVFDKVFGRVEAHIPEALHAGLCELAGNVCFHAQVENGFAAAQTIPARGSILFAVADGGIGVKQSLEATHHPADAREALGLAVKYGVSGTGEVGRGSGLSDVMDTVAGGLGRFTIISGNAILVKRYKVTPKIRTINRPYPGTLIAGQVGC